jgi:hypothetical protein
MTACSFRWIIVTKSIVRWFIVREKHCWMTADLADQRNERGDNYCYYYIEDGEKPVI